MNALAWTAEQIRSLGPQRAAVPDRFERTGEWVVGMRRPVTWVDLARAHDIGRYEAMRRLREAAQRGLIRRVRSEHANRPDEFEGRR